MRAINITQARKDIYNLVEQTAQFSEQILITGKKHNAVLISEEDWNSLQETLYLLSIPGMKERLLDPNPDWIDEKDINWDTI